MGVRFKSSAYPKTIIYGRRTNTLPLSKNALDYPNFCHSEIENSFKIWWGGAFVKPC